MTDLNLVMIEGRLGEDPKISRQGKRSHARCRVATNRRWKGEDGEWNERATWHTVVAFDAVAEQIALLRKGDGIFVRGELNVREYVTSDETVRHEHQIVAHDVRAPLKILVAGADSPRPSHAAPRPDKGFGRSTESASPPAVRTPRPDRPAAPPPVPEPAMPARTQARPARPVAVPQAEDELPAEDVFSELEQFIHSGGDQ